jgi:epoxyqueuosine reductase
MRAKRIGMQRNACIALGNAGDSRAIPALATALREAAPLVRRHAAWSLGRIGGDLAASALEGSLQTETDADVTAEILAALADMKSHS